MMEIREREFSLQSAYETANHKLQTTLTATKTISLPDLNTLKTYSHPSPAILSLFHALFALLYK